MQHLPAACICKVRPRVRKWLSSPGFSECPDFLLPSMPCYGLLGAERVFLGPFFFHK